MEIFNTIATYIIIALILCPLALWILCGMLNIFYGVLSLLNNLLIALAWLLGKLPFVIKLLESLVVLILLPFTVCVYGFQVIYKKLFNENISNEL